MSAEIIRKGGLMNRNMRSFRNHFGFSDHVYRYFGASLVYTVIKYHFDINFSFQETIIIAIGLGFITK